ncbi:hypothetical protein LDENG_00032960 [Lucifuga dentata]|nr:hypothetical protein LDENG_00032960 [Lucifuga dentata]
MNWTEYESQLRNSELKRRIRQILLTVIKLRNSRNIMATTSIRDVKQSVLICSVISQLLDMDAIKTVRKEILLYPVTVETLFQWSLIHMSKHNHYGQGMKTD